MTFSFYLQFFSILDGVFDIPNLIFFLRAKTAIVSRGKAEFCREVHREARPRCLQAQFGSIRPRARVA